MEEKEQEKAVGPSKSGNIGIEICRPILFNLGRPFSDLKWYDQDTIF